MNPAKHRLTALSIVAGCVLAGCGYRNLVGPLRPASEAAQPAQIRIDDDGSVVFSQDRLEVSLRPMTDEELNRQLATISSDGLLSANPYTYSNWVDPEIGETPQRFTVFLLKVKNYEFPKVLLDPEQVHITADVGRSYRPLSLAELDDYYLSYATGYAGNPRRLYEHRRDVLRRTMFNKDLVFSGQEKEGFLVFPILHPAIQNISVQLEYLVLRFDFSDRPLEVRQVDYVFEREIRRMYPSRSMPSSSRSPSAG